MASNKKYKIYNLADGSSMGVSRDVANMMVSTGGFSWSAPDNNDIQSFRAKAGMDKPKSKPVVQQSLRQALGNASQQSATPAAPIGGAPTRQRMAFDLWNLQRQGEWNNFLNQSRQSVNRTIKNARKPNPGQIGVHELNPKTGKWEKAYYANTGERVTNQWDLYRANKWWEDNTPQGIKSRDNRLAKEDAVNIKQWDAKNNMQVMSKYFPEINQLQDLEKKDPKAAAAMRLKLSEAYRELYPATKEQGYDPFMQAWFSSPINPEKLGRNTAFNNTLIAKLTKSGKESSEDYLRRMTKKAESPIEQLWKERMDAMRKDRDAFVAKGKEAQAAKRERQQKELQPILQKAYTEAQGRYDKEEIGVYELASWNDPNPGAAALVATSMNDIKYARIMDPAKMTESVVNNLSQEQIDKIAEDDVRTFIAKYPNANAGSIAKVREKALEDYIENVVYKGMKQYATAAEREKMKGAEWLASFKEKTLLGLAERAYANHKGYGGFGARSEAVQQWEKEHPWQGFLVSGAEVASNPFTWISSGMGCVAGKLAQGVVGKAIASGMGNFATFNLLHGIAGQIEVGEFNPAELALAATKGAITGGTLGVAGGLVGNVTNNAVKAVAERGLAAQLATKATGQVAGLGAEIGVFGASDMLMEGKSAKEAFANTAKMVLAFKAVGAVQHGLPKVGAHAADIAMSEGTLGGKARNLPREIAQRYVGNSGLLFTSSEKRELRNAGYYDVVDFGDALGSAKSHKEAEAPTLPNHDRLAAFLQDDNISWSARAKLSYALTGERVPVPTVLAADRYERNGKHVVDVLGEDGKVIESREFLTERSAKHAYREASMQAERNRMHLAETKRVYNTGENRVNEAAERVAQYLNNVGTNESGSINRTTIQRTYYSAQAKRSEAASSNAEPQLTEGELAIERMMQKELQDIDEKAKISNLYGGVHLVMPKRAREVIKSRTGVDIDDVLSKPEHKRTEADNKALSMYTEYLSHGNRESRDAWAKQKVLEETGIDLRRLVGDPEKHTQEQQAATEMYRKYLADVPNYEDPTVPENLDKALVKHYNRGFRSSVAEEDAIIQEYNDAYEAYYNAVGTDFDGMDAMGNVILPTRSHTLDSILDGMANSERAYTPEQFEATRRLYEAAAAYEGLMASLRDDIARVRAEELAAMDQITHADGKTIRPVVMRDGRDGYIVEGEVPMKRDEGDANPVVDKSRETSLVVYYKESHEREQVSSSDVKEVLPVKDATEQKQNIEARIEEQGIIAEMSYEIRGESDSELQQRKSLCEDELQGCEPGSAEAQLAEMKLQTVRREIAKRYVNRLQDAFENTQSEIVSEQQVIRECEGAIASPMATAEQKEAAAERMERAENNIEQAGVLMEELKQRMRDAGIRVPGEDAVAKEETADKDVEIGNDNVEHEGVASEPVNDEQVSAPTIPDVPENGRKVDGKGFARLSDGRVIVIADYDKENGLYTFAEDGAEIGETGFAEPRDQAWMDANVVGFVPEGEISKGIGLTDADGTVLQAGDVITDGARVGKVTGRMKTPTLHEIEWGDGSLTGMNNRMLTSGGYRKVENSTQPDDVASGHGGRIADTEETVKNGDHIAEGRNKVGQAENTPAGNAETPAAEPQGNSDEMPMKAGKGKEKEPEPDWEAAGVERSHKFIFDDLGLSREDGRATVERNLKNAEAEKKKAESRKPSASIVANPIKLKGFREQQTADIAKAEERIKFWQDVLKIETDMEADIERKLKEQGIGQPEPTDAEVAEMYGLGEDVVAEWAENDAYGIVLNALGSKGRRLAPESIKQHTGMSGKEVRMPGVVAKEKNGGISIERCAELICADSPILNGKDMEVRDIIIDILQSGGNPRSVEKNRREGILAQSRRMYEDELAAYRHEIEEAYGMDYDEWEAYQEQAWRETAEKHQHFDESEYNANLAEDFEKQQKQEINGRENESAGVGTEDGRGGDILSEAGSADGVGVQEGNAGEPRGETGDGVQVHSSDGAASGDAEPEPDREVRADGEKHSIESGAERKSGFESNEHSGGLHRRSVVLFDRVGRQLDLRIRFGTAEECGGTRGVFRPRTGEIIINEDYLPKRGATEEQKQQHVLSVIFGHEVSHGLKEASSERPEMWDAFRDTVHEYVGEKLWDEFMAERREKYKKKYRYDENDAEQVAKYEKLIEEEVCADFAGEMIAQNPERFRRLVDRVAESSEKPHEVWQRFLSFMAYIRDSIRKLLGNSGTVVLGDAYRNFESMYEYVAAKVRESGTLERRSDIDRLSIMGVKGASMLDRARETSYRIDNLDVARRMEEQFKAETEEKKTRIDKLRQSEPVRITGTEIVLTGDQTQDKKNALEYGKKLQGTYTNIDTGDDRESGITPEQKHSIETDDGKPMIADVEKISNFAAEDVAKRLDKAFWEGAAEKDRVGMVEYLQQSQEGRDVIDRLYRHRGTPWSKAASNSALVRIALEDVIQGREPSVASMLAGHKIVQRIQRQGTEGIWGYLMDKRIIGNAAKCVNNVNGSYTSCRPSDNCAEFCYASKGNSASTNSIVKNELVNWAVRTDPKRVAEMIARQYAAKFESSDNKALRLFEAGDLDEAWLPVIEELNRRGIVTQIFSKNPEVLQQVDRTKNVVMLSVDASNLHLLEQYPDVPVAFVYASPEDLPALQQCRDRFEKYGGSILPVVEGKNTLSKEDLSALPQWTHRFQCPVDNGIRKINNKERPDLSWNCTKCDSKGGVGCFYHRTTQTIKEVVNEYIRRDDIATAAAKMRRGAEAGNAEGILGGIPTLPHTDNSRGDSDFRRRILRTLREGGVPDANITTELLEALDSICRERVAGRGVQADLGEVSGDSPVATATAGRGQSEGLRPERGGGIEGEVKYSTAVEDGRRMIGEKEVENVFIDENDAPKTRKEALAILDGMTQPFPNADQGVDIYVSKGNAKHTMSFRNDDQIKLIGQIDKVIYNAVKIGELPVDEDEVATTKSVSIYYCPVRVGDKQYSARMVVKEYFEGDKVIDQLNLYNARLRDEKNNPTRPKDLTDAGLLPHPSGIERYKVSELIHNTQIGDKQLLGIDTPTRFSIDDNQKPMIADIERETERINNDRELVAVHNIDEKKLASVLRLDGFPMPSISITKDKVGHTDFGEISLVFNKETINPEVSHRNTVWDRDAYTPTFPEIEKKLSDKVIDRVSDKVNSLVARKERVGSLMLDEGNLRDKLRSYGWDAKEAFAGNHVLKQAYLAEHGEKLEVPRMQKEYFGDYGSNELLEQIVNTIREAGIDVHDLSRLDIALREAYEKYEKGEPGGELIDKIREIAFADSIESVKQKIKEAPHDKFLNTLLEYYLRLSYQDFSRISDAVQRIQYDKVNNQGKLPEIPDTESAKKQIDHILPDTDNGYREWLSNLLKGIVEKEGIHNGKDPYTASGDKRSFEATHDPVNIVNILKAMQRAPEKATSVFAHPIFAAAKKLSNLEDIRREGHKRIKPMTKEEVEQLKDTVVSVLSEIASDIERGDMDMRAMDDLRDIIATHGRDAKAMYDDLHKYRPMFTLKMAEKLADLVKHVQEAPVDFLEAKPRRIVGIDEIKLAVVPTDADARLVQQLRDRGIDVRSYERGNEQQRIDIVDKASQELDIKFSIEGNDGGMIRREDVSRKEWEDISRLTLEAAQEGCAMRGEHRLITNKEQLREALTEAGWSEEGIRYYEERIRDDGMVVDDNDYPILGGYVPGTNIIINFVHSYGNIEDAYLNHKHETLHLIAAHNAELRDAVLRFGNVVNRYLPEFSERIGAVYKGRTNRLIEELAANFISQNVKDRIWDEEVAKLPASALSDLRTILNSIGYENERTVRAATFGRCYVQIPRAYREGIKRGSEARLQEFGEETQGRKSGGDDDEVTPITPEEQYSTETDGRPMIQSEDLGASVGSEGGKPMLSEMSYAERKAKAKGDAQDVMNRLAASQKFDKADMQKGRDAVANYVRTALAANRVSMLHKSELNTILSRVKKVDNYRTLQGCLLDVDRVVTEIEKRKHLMDIDQMLKVRLQEKDKKGKSIAKGVDDETRRSMQLIRQNLREMRSTEYDAAIKSINSELYQLRLRRSVAEMTGDQAGLAEINSLYEERVNALNEQKAELEALQKEEQVAKLGTAARDWEARLLELEAKAKDPETEFTTDNGIERQALRILKQIVDADRIGETATVDPETKEVVSESIKGIRELYDKHKAKRCELWSLYRGEKEDKDKKAAHKRAWQYAVDQMTACREMENALLDKQTKMYESAAGDMRELLVGGAERLHQEIEAEIENGKRIVSAGIKDIDRGKSWEQYKWNGKRKDLEKRGKFDEIMHAIFGANLDSFHYMTQSLSTSMSGRGFLYKEFMEGEHGFMAARSEQLHREQANKKMLDEAAARFLGKRGRGDEFQYYANKYSKVDKNCGVTCLDMSRGEDEAVRVQAPPMSKGTAMYLYQLWNMADGRMKLRKMGFDEQSYQEILQFIGPKLKEFADWMVEEYYPTMKTDLNKGYRELYHTTLPVIENYVPIRINHTDTMPGEEQVSGGNSFSKALEKLNSSLVDRTVNTLSIDMSQTAFKVLAEHGAQNIEWMSFARLRKNLDHLLGSRAFRNTLNANHAGRYKEFVEAARIAVLMPTEMKVTGLDKAVGAYTSGRIAGNIIFRWWTAAKQKLSAPAFCGYAQDARFLALVARYEFTPLANYKWAKENMPTFAKRIEMGFSGSSDIVRELREMEGDGLVRWSNKFVRGGMWANKKIDALTCAAGARAVYEYEMLLAKDRIAAGADPAGLREMALRRAQIAFNSDQQSSEAAFLSSTQTSGTALARLSSAYQQANIGYTRKAIIGMQDMRKGIMHFDEQVRMLMESEGLTEQQAKTRVRSAVRKGLFNSALYGLVLKLLWDNSGKLATVAASSLTLGIAPWEAITTAFEEDEDDKDGEEKSKFAKWLARACYIGGTLIQGSTIGNLFHDGFFEYSPISLFTDDGRDKIKRIYDKYGWSTELAGQTVNVMLNTFFGVRPDTYANIYDGACHLAERGIDPDLALDVAMVLSMPQDARAGWVKQRMRKGDYSPAEYAKAMSYALRYREEAGFGLTLGGYKPVTDKSQQKIMSNYIPNPEEDQKWEDVKEYYEGLETRVKANHNAFRDDWDGLSNKEYDDVQRLHKITKLDETMSKQINKWATNMEGNEKSLDTLFNLRTELRRMAAHPEKYDEYQFELMKEKAKDLLPEDEDNGTEKNKKKIKWQK